MPGDLNLLIAVAGFLAGCAVLVVAGLTVIGLVLRAEARHRRRLVRVGRRRLSGQIDLDETRLHLLRRQKEGGRVGSLADALARVVPLLDAERLKTNIRRSGLSLSITAFVLIALALAGVYLALAVVVLGFSPVLGALPALVAGMLTADMGVRLRAEAMSERFMKQLPGALDTIIRGVRAGLPVIEGIANVGAEFEDPIGGHFRTIAERVQLGESLDLALWRTAQTIDRPEMDFLAICISIQMETGGSLAEALGNLADLLRRREAMKLKIRAISSEAKASAMIIGALPFVMMGLLGVMNPAYVAPLFLDPRGQVMLMCGLASIGLGAMVMWRMTKFDI